MSAFKLDTYMIIEEVAACAHVSIRHIKEEIKRKNLKAHKPGKRLLFEPSEVQKWLNKKVAK